VLPHRHVFDAGHLLGLAKFSQGLEDAPQLLSFDCSPRRGRELFAQTAYFPVQKRHLLVDIDYVNEHFCMVAERRTRHNRSLYADRDFGYVARPSRSTTKNRVRLWRSIHE